MKVDFMIDEAALLGQMDCVEDALNIGRAYEISLFLFYQARAGPMKCFPHGQHTTLDANTTQIFFGANDLQTAKEMSDWTGEATILVEGWNSQRGGSLSVTDGGRSRTAGHSWSESRDTKQQARKLFKPEEILAMPRDSVFTHVPGLHPVVTKLVQYFREPGLFKPVTLRDCLCDFIRALLFGICMCFIAWLVTAIATKQRTMERLEYLVQTLEKGGRR